MKTELRESSESSSKSSESSDRSLPWPAFLRPTSEGESVDGRVLYPEVP